MATFFVKSNGNLVAGFSAAHSCVQTTVLDSYAKVFKTEKAAVKFIEKYSGAGYGLSKSTCVVVKNSN